MTHERSNFFEYFLLYNNHQPLPDNDSFTMTYSISHTPSKDILILPFLAQNNYKTMIRDTIAYNTDCLVGMKFDLKVINFKLL
jgi:hypothetical protein